MDHGKNKHLNGQTRLEAFSDGVIAIIITIMVLELKPPHGAALATLLPLWPTFMSYVLSFIYVGIYWNKLQYGSHPPAGMSRIQQQLTLCSTRLIVSGWPSLPVSL